MSIETLVENDNYAIYIYIYIYISGSTVDLNLKMYPKIFFPLLYFYFLGLFRKIERKVLTLTRTRQLQNRKEDK